MKTKLLLFLCAATFILSATARAAYYLYTDLGITPTYTYFDPTGINNKGEVVGTAYEYSGRPVAFRHTSGSFQFIASPGPAHSAWGRGINSSGTVVGQCDRTGSVYHAFYDDPSEPLPVDFDSDFTRNSDALAVNDHGYVVGLASSQAFLGHTSGWIFLLGSTLGADFRAKDLNNNLVIVGNGPWGGLTYNAWTGTTTHLGWALGSFNNRAEVINESGAVAGRKGAQGFIYAGGAATFFGAGVTDVKGINKAGDVVGIANGRAFVYRRASNDFIDLNNAISPTIAATWTLISATGINDSGVICGQARRLATPADDPDYGMYIYRTFKVRPLPIFQLPLPLGIEH